MMQTIISFLILLYMAKGIMEGVDRIYQAEKKGFLRPGLKTDIRCFLAVVLWSFIWPVKHFKKGERE